MAANKRRQDEKHLKILRELGSQPNNKQCFDCHQRGPTYVNMTIGSFVCTSCSGILRGLNPPHRVKSISMTSFTPEEIEFIRSRGNEYCRRVWLGTYDSRTMAEPESKDEQRIKDFMIQKYERKRWYVDPSVAMRNVSSPLQSSTPSSASATSLPETKPLSSILGNQVRPLVVQNNQAMNSVRPLTTSTSLSSAMNSNQQPARPSLDLLSDLVGDPFASSAAGGQTGSHANANFANFDNFTSSDKTGSFCTIHNKAAKDVLTFPDDSSVFPMHDSPPFIPQFEFQVSTETYEFPNNIKSSKHLSISLGEDLNVFRNNIESKNDTEISTSTWNSNEVPGFLQKASDPFVIDNITASNPFQQKYKHNSNCDEFTLNSVATDCFQTFPLQKAVSELVISDPFSSSFVIEQDFSPVQKLEKNAISKSMDFDFLSADDLTSDKKSFSVNELSDLLSMSIGKQEKEDYIDTGSTISQLPSDCELNMSSLNMKMQKENTAQNKNLKLDEKSFEAHLQNDFSSSTKPSLVLKEKCENQFALDQFNDNQNKSNHYNETKSVSLLDLHSFSNDKDQNKAFKNDNSNLIKYSFFSLDNDLNSCGLTDDKSSFCDVSSIVNSSSENTLYETTPKTSEKSLSLMTKNVTESLNGMDNIQVKPSHILEESPCFRPLDISNNSNSPKTEVVSDDASTLFKISDLVQGMSSPPSAGGTPMSTTSAGSQFGGFTSAGTPGSAVPQTPVSSVTQNKIGVVSPTSQDSNVILSAPPKDKYAALADLDNLFNSATNANPTVEWDAAKTTTTAGWTINGTSAPVYGGNTNNSAFTSHFSTVSPNPFSSTTQQSWTPTQSQATFSAGNPFVSGFGTQTTTSCAGTYSQFGGTSVTSPPGFGSTTPNGQLGSFAMQNGGFSSSGNGTNWASNNTSGWVSFGSQPQQPFASHIGTFQGNKMPIVSSASVGQFNSWQPSMSNPFISGSGTLPPRGTSSNPFL